MKVIKRNRNSGKTTLLLHLMEAEPFSCMVCRTSNICDKIKDKSDKLGLHISRERFYSSIDVEKIHERYRIFVDDADYITELHPELGYNLLGKADVITITSKGNKITDKTYKIETYCVNCGAGRAAGGTAATFEIPKGQPIEYFLGPKVCGNCGCRSCLKSK